PISLSKPVGVGLCWPAEAALREFKVERLLKPAITSPLEDGDDLYNLRDYEGARLKYRTVLLPTTSDQVRSEARYKEGLCLLAQGRTEDAIGVFQALAEQPEKADAAEHQNWPVLANCRLLLIYHHQNNAAGQARANTILDLLVNRPSY